MDEVRLLWGALVQIRTLAFIAQSHSRTGWNGKGTGTVVVQSPAPDTVVLQETGIWYPASANGQKLHFRNTYRWIRQEKSIRLEHLRFGESQPVYLFDLAPETEMIWSSSDPHLCRSDEYTARLRRDDSGIALHWKVIGPEKNETIDYRYDF